MANSRKNIDPCRQWLGCRNEISTATIKPMSMAESRSRNQWRYSNSLPSPFHVADVSHLALCWCWQQSSHRFEYSLARHHCTKFVNHCLQQWSHFAEVASRVLAELYNHCRLLTIHYETMLCCCHLVVSFSMWIWHSSYSSSSSCCSTWSQHTPRQHQMLGTVSMTMLVMNN